MYQRIEISDSYNIYGICPSVQVSTETVVHACTTLMKILKRLLRLVQVFHLSAQAVIKPIFREHTLRPITNQPSEGSDQPCNLPFVVLSRPSNDAKLLSSGQR